MHQAQQSSTHPPDWVTELFRTIDAGDAEGFARFLTDDARFRFGNAPSVQGREAIRAAVGGFFASVREVRHELAETWTLPDTLICQGQATYTCHDGSAVTVPFANILKMERNLIREYLIYVDASPLFAPVSTSA
jgi:uncharacterized protein (TIGR02246 family)